MENRLQVKDLYDYISNEKDIQIEMNCRDGSKFILYKGLMENLPYCYSEEVLWDEAIEVTENGLIKISVGYTPRNFPIKKRKEEFEDLNEKETLLKLSKLLHHLDSIICNDDTYKQYKDCFEDVSTYVKDRLGKILYEDFIGGETHELDTNK